MYLLLRAKSCFLVVSLAIKYEFYFFGGEFERNDRNVLLDSFAMKRIFSFECSRILFSASAQESTKETLCDPKIKKQKYPKNNSRDCHR